MYYLAEVVTNKLEAILDSDIIEVNPVSGGDIHDAKQIKTAGGQIYFVKLNDEPDSLAMFQTEAQGLRLLKKNVANSIYVPKVIAFERAGDFAFLLMEFIVSSPTPTDFWQKFGHGLAALHRNNSGSFGLDHHNFIGRLAQANTACPDWAEFYTTQRLLPQAKLAYENLLLDLRDIQHLENLCKRLDEIYPHEPASLIHGDLWNGNYLVHPDGLATLIDPAASFSHREMDIAMSKLFGGFPDEFYASYEEHFPLATNWPERLPIGQLYYLLVHLNLFGQSYRPAVKRIIKKF